jgi:hypothetical protein
VPILTLHGVHAKNIFVNENELTSSEYSVDGSHIIIHKTELDINLNTKAHLILEFQTKNFLEKFWLPIIIAVIGSIGTISQPILNKLNLIYVYDPPPIEYKVRLWGYDGQKHEYYIRIVVKNLNKKESDAWKLIIGLRQHNEILEPQKDNYKIVSNSYDVNDLVNMRVKADEAFTASLFSDNVPAQGVIFKIKKGTIVNRPFDPNNYSSDTVQFLGGYSTNPD